jgi:hypothetical protein
MHRDLTTKKHLKNKERSQVLFCLNIIQIKTGEFFFKEVLQFNCTRCFITLTIFKIVKLLSVVIVDDFDFWES